MNLNVIKDEAIEILKHIPYKPFFCLPMSALLYASLKDKHGIECKLVTGHLGFKNEFVFKQDFSIDFSENKKIREWTGHAWVECDNLICDLSFFRSLYSSVFTKTCKEELITLFGEGRGLLISTPEDMKLIGLHYQSVDTLSDEHATAIINGLPYLI